MFKLLKQLGKNPESITPRGSTQHQERIIEIAGLILGEDLILQEELQKLEEKDTSDIYPKNGNKVSIERCALTQIQQQQAIADAREAENTRNDDIPTTEGRKPCQLQKDEARGHKRSRFGR